MYSDTDVASSALRNLRQYEVQGRKLKAAFASDNKIGNNLSTKDLLYRDPAEIIKTQALNTMQQQNECAVVGEILNCQNSTTDEMLECLSEEQQELLMYTIRDVYKHAGEAQGRTGR